MDFRKIFVVRRNILYDIYIIFFYLLSFFTFISNIIFPFAANFSHIYRKFCPRYLWHFISYISMLQKMATYIMYMWQSWYINFVAVKVFVFFGMLNPFCFITGPPHYPVWLDRLTHLMREAHSHWPPFCLHSQMCKNDTRAAFQKKLGCQEIETNISSAYEN